MTSVVELPGEKHPRVETSTGYFLLTGGDEVPADLEEALGVLGEVQRCPGVSCPAVRGKSCSLRSDAKAAVVFLAGEHEFFMSRRWECVTAGMSPVVVVLEGPGRSTAPSDGFAVVAGDAGSAAVVAVLTEMC